jgi:hypothetical protein
MRTVFREDGHAIAVLTTELVPKPDKRTGRVPTEEERARWQRVIPIMNEILQDKGLVNVAEDRSSSLVSKARWKRAGTKRWRRSWPGSPSSTPRPDAAP